MLPFTITLGLILTSMSPKVLLENLYGTVPHAMYLLIYFCVAVQYVMKHVVPLLWLFLLYLLLQLLSFYIGKNKITKPQQLV